MKHGVSPDDNKFISAFRGATALLGICQSTVSNGDIDQQVSLDTPDPVQHSQTHRRSGCDHKISPGVLSPDQSQPDRSTANSSEFLTHESTSTQVPGQLHRASTTIIRNQVFIDLTLVDDDPSSMGSLTRKERKPTDTEFSAYTNRRGLLRRKRTRRVRGTVAVKDIIVID
ncbi:hypothetical protein BKA56DRAFT_622139 [Ilyonectria sp. MPI-CAGE-AT-0026]|nr:hypothetical protein BKA56DRAFT_622139 [Ilyonectria sp. MPI-CAGE-AT-0026]